MRKTNFNKGKSDLGKDKIHFLDKQIMKFQNYKFYIIIHQLFSGWLLEQIFAQTNPTAGKIVRHCIKFTTKETSLQSRKGSFLFKLTRFQN